MNVKMILFFAFLHTTLCANNVGLASWYGEKFQGRTTASGEPFNMYAYTAAHKTLPFGTIVKVINLKNGKSVNVKVNDRGPYKVNRIMDISYQAAKTIGLVTEGTGRVRLQVKGSEPQVTNSRITPSVVSSALVLSPATNKDLASMMEYALMVTAPKKVVKKEVKKQETFPRKVKMTKNLKVQIASFSTKSGAEQFIEKLKNRGYKMAVIPVFSEKSQQTRYKVVILTNSEEAALSIVNSKEYNGAYILR